MKPISPLIVVHDQFDGSAHCIECGGDCRLTGIERAYTKLVRFTLEHAAILSDVAWVTTCVQSSIVEAMGLDRFHVLRMRAIESMREIRQRDAARA